MLQFTCESCLRIYHAVCLKGKVNYMIKNKRFLLLSDEQVCDDCEKRLEKKVKEEKEVIQKETMGI